MLKNAYFSIKKNIGKTILLFVIMIVIANLIIAGLSIQSASKESMKQLRSSLGSDVTLTVNMQNMMGNREKGQAISEVQSSITIDMAKQLIDLKHVENYNYTISTNVNSDSIEPVELEISQQQMPEMPEGFEQAETTSSDFTIAANTTMAYLDDFTSGDYSLIEGRLLSQKDADTDNCVIETNVASDNDLEVGDTFEINQTVDGETVTKTLTIVGIYEVGNTLQIMGPNQSNPINTIYTDLSVGQIITGSDTNISSATYYLDDPENMDSFVEEAKSVSDIDFETYSLNTNDQLYQRNVASLENTQSFATMFLVIVIAAGSVILGLILMLTIRGRFYEIGVFLSLGQSKLKIIGQQVLEIGIIALAAFTISLGTGKMVSNVISNMLVDGDNNNQLQMEMPRQSDMSSMPSSNQTSKESSGFGGISDMFTSPDNQELDVSINGATVMQLAGITAAICVVSVFIPSLYVLRLSPREILVRREG